MLNLRQTLFYLYTVDIYRKVTTPINGDVGTKLVTDHGSTYSKIASGVKCMFWSTPENDEVTEMGRTKSVNIFTMDRWKFDSAVDIQDTDTIVCTAGPNGFSQVGRCWLVQGNTQNHNTLSISNTQMVYGKLSTAPAGVS